MRRVSTYSRTMPLVFLFCLAAAAQEQPASTSYTKSTHLPRDSAVEQSNPPEPAGAAQRALPPDKMGDLMMARKRYSEAVDEYLEALRETEEEAPLLLTRSGVALHRMEDLDGAAKRYQQVLQLDPKSVAALNNLGTVRYEKGQFKDAEKQYERALGLASDAAAIHRNLGMALFARQKYSQAMESYERALRLDADVFEKRDAEDSLLRTPRATEQAKFHFSLSRVYSELGMGEKAGEHLKKAREGGFQGEELKDKGGFFDWLFGWLK